MHASLWLLLQQSAAPAAKGGAPVWWWPVEIGLIIAIFYFVMIRPQRRQQEAQRQLLASVQKGDQVVTASGIVGEVIYLKDDQVTIRTGEAKIVVLKTAIAQITNRAAAEAKAS
jgi:preprotein translocase subunit YajC